jgi:hypothetical protein
MIKWTVCVLLQTYWAVSSSITNPVFFFKVRPWGQLCSDFVTGYYLSTWPMLRIFASLFVDMLWHIKLHTSASKENECWGPSRRRASRRATPWRRQDSGGWWPGRGGGDGQAAAGAAAKEIASSASPPTFQTAPASHLTPHACRSRSPLPRCSSRRQPPTVRPAVRPARLAHCQLPALAQMQSRRDGIHF